MGRPDFNVLHYATDTGVWREYFAPGLHQAFGVLWPLVLAGALAGALIALLRGPGRARALDRGRGAVRHRRLPGHPAERGRRRGRPGGLRDQHPLRRSRRCCSGPALLPLAPAFGVAAQPVAAARRAARRAGDHRPLRRRPPRPASGSSGWRWRLLVVGAPAALLWRPARAAPRAAWCSPAGRRARRWRRSRSATRCSATTCATASRDFDPSMNLDTAYRWASGVSDARIGLAGTTAGFLGYGFYGTDLSNRVVYLGARARTGPSTRSRPAGASAPRSTTPTSTTWSPPRSSTSSTPSGRSARRRRPGCAASRR